ncbi:MAG: nucleotidyltransferase domain-containing protein [Gammaproteobacteria bacterium]|nr:nucleotidyltransferase domain-containing protein [Gammaproteobacteria bacterium]
MLNIERIKPKIVEALMPVSPIKIILFGSYAYGNLTEDSDLDVLVVEENSITTRGALTFVRP